ncbi:hypothetical protein BGW41_007601 [Actinomortierella wolfii]|nr:hypothetical protein BGW41_007601 [Actinomortierella wolfii]
MVVNFQEGIAPLRLIATAVSSSLLNNSDNQCACASRQSSYQSLNTLASDYPLITWDCRSKLGPPSSVQREIQRLFQLYQMGLTAHPDAIDLEKTFRLWRPQFEAMDKFAGAEERRRRHQTKEEEHGHQLALDPSSDREDPIMAACRAFLIETGIDDPVDWFLKRPSEIDLALVKIEGELATLYKLTLSLQKNLAVQLRQLQALEKAVIDECRLLDGARSCTQVLGHLEKFFRSMALCVDVHPKHDEPSFLLQATIAGSKRHVPQENVDSDTFGLPAKRLAAGEDDYPLRASDNVPILHSIFDAENDQDDEDVDISGSCSLLLENDEISEQDDEQVRSGNVGGPFRPRSLEQFLSALHFRPSLLVSRFERWIEEAPTREGLEVNKWVSKCLRDDFVDNDRDDYVLGIVNNQDGAGEENGSRQQEDACFQNEIGVQDVPLPNQPPTFVSIVESILADIQSAATLGEDLSGHLCHVPLVTPVLHLPNTRGWQLSWLLGLTDSSSELTGTAGHHRACFLSRPSNTDFLLQETHPQQASAMFLRDAWPVLAQTQKQAVIQTLARLLVQVWRHLDFISVTNFKSHDSACQNGLAQAEEDVNGREIHNEQHEKQDVHLPHKESATFDAQLSLDEHFLSDDGQLWDQEKEAKILTLRFCESTFEEAMQRITACDSKAIPVTMTCPSESPTATASPVFSSVNYIEVSQEYSRPVISKHVFNDCWMTTTEAEAYEQGEHLSASNSEATNSDVNFDCGGYYSENPCRRLLNASMEVFDFSLDDLLVQLVPETDKVDSLGSSSTSSVAHPVILVGVGRWKEFDFPTSYSSSPPPSQQPSSLAGVSRDDALPNQHYPSPISGYCHHHYPTSMNDLQKSMRSSRYPLVHLFTLPDFLCSGGELGLPSRRSTRPQEHQEDQPFNSVESATQDNNDNQKYLESLTQQLVFLDDQAADMWAGTRQEKEVLVYHRWMACWHQRALWRL